MPTADLYDTGMMREYINNVKEQYQQGLKDYEEFMTKYGDFTSPIAADVEYVDNNTMKPMEDLVDSLYAQGIDPLRSPEARALIAQARHKVPYAEIAKRKMSAAAAEQYMKAAGEAAAKGQYSQPLEDMFGRNLANWDTSKNGMWTSTAPTQFKDLNSLTEAWFDKLEPSDLGTTADGRYRRVGISEKALNNSMATQLPGFLGTELGKYYYDQAKNAVAAEGGDPTDDTAVMNRLKHDIVTANNEKLNVKLVADPYATAAYSAKLQAAQAEAAAKRASALADKKHKYAMDEIALRYGLKNGESGLSSQTNYVDAIVAKQYEHEQELVGDNYRYIYRNLKRAAVIKGKDNPQNAAAYNKIADEFKKLMKAKKSKEAYQLLGRYGLAVVDKSRGAHGTWVLSDKYKNLVDATNDRRTGSQMRQYTNAAGSYEAGLAKWNDERYERYHANVNGLYASYGSTQLADNNQTSSQNTKNGTVTFGGNVQMSRMRRATVTNQGYRSATYTRRLNDYLTKNHVQGTVSGNVDTYSVGNNIDYSGYVRIPLGKVERNDKGEIDTDTKIYAGMTRSQLEQAGAKVVTDPAAHYDSNNGYVAQDYLEIPTTRTRDAVTEGEGSLNNGFRAYFSKSQAGKTAGSDMDAASIAQDVAETFVNAMGD